MTASIVQILRDPSHAGYTVADTHGIWLAVTPSSGNPYVVRYAPDSGRWIKVTLANSFPFAGTQCMAFDAVSDRLYALQYDSGTDQGYLSVIDTSASGSLVFGLTAVTGLIHTFTLAPIIGTGPLGTPLGLVRDAATGSLWTYSDARLDDATPSFFNLDPATGHWNKISILGTVGSNGAQDIFADGGFLYWSEIVSFGYIYQFPISGVGSTASIPGGTGTGPIHVYNGGLNNGTVGGFDVDPTNGNIVALCNSGEATFFGNTAGYIVIQPSTFTVVGQASSASQGTALTVDASGNVWFVRASHFEKYVGGTLTYTKPNLPGAFSQSSQYAYRWFSHTNRQPTLFAGDAEAGGNGALYVGDDASTPTPMYSMGNVTNAPITTHVIPNELIPGTNTAYPVNDQMGLWVSSVTKVVHYSPGRGDPKAFFLVPLPNSVVIPPNGVAEDQSTFTRLYVLDQAKSFIWVIDTSPVLDLGGNLAGVTGIIGYLDLTSTWAAGSATFAGLAFDSVTTFDLFTAVGTTTIYRIKPTTGAVTTHVISGGNAGKALLSGPGLAPILWAGTSQGDTFDPSTFAINGGAGTNAALVGASADATYYYGAEQGAGNNVNAFGSIHIARFNPGSGPVIGNTFSGDTVTLHGVAGGTPEIDNNPTNGPTVWAAFSDSTAGTHNIVNYIIGGDNNFQKWAKVIPSPFVFSATGNYGQGSYGFAWLDTPISLVFASDNTNNELWSGGLSNSPMAVETLFNYATSTSAASSITADSSFGPAHLLGGTIQLSANIVADSDVFNAGVYSFTPEAARMCLDIPSQRIYVLGLPAQVYGATQTPIIWTINTNTKSVVSVASYTSAAFAVNLGIAPYGGKVWLSDTTSKLHKVDPLTGGATIYDKAGDGFTSAMFYSPVVSGSTLYLGGNTSAPVGLLGVYSATDASNSPGPVALSFVNPQLDVNANTGGVVIDFNNFPSTGDIATVSGATVTYASSPFTSAANAAEASDGTIFVKNGGNPPPNPAFDIYANISSAPTASVVWPGSFVPELSGILNNTLYTQDEGSFSLYSMASDGSSFTVVDGTLPSITQGIGDETRNGLWFLVGHDNSPSGVNEVLFWNGTTLNTIPLLPPPPVGAYLSGGTTQVSEHLVADSSFGPAHLLGGTVSLDASLVAGSSMAPAELDPWAPFAQPISVAFDGNFLWMSDEGTGLVYKIDPATVEVVAVVNPGVFGVSQVREVAYDAGSSGYIFLSCETSSLVLMVNPISNEIVGKVQLIGGSRARSVAPDGVGNFWVLGYKSSGNAPFNSDSTLYKFSAASVVAAFPSNGTPTATHTYNGYHFQQITFGGGFIWAGGGYQENPSPGPDGRNGGILQRIDPSTGAMVEHGNDLINVWSYNAFYAFGNVWSCGGAEYFFKWDVTTFNTITLLPGNPSHFNDPAGDANSQGEIVSDGTSLWMVTTSYPFVYQISPVGSGSITAKIAGVPLLDSSFDGVTFDGTYIWVTSRGGTAPGLVRVTPGAPRVTNRLTNAHPLPRDAVASLQANSSISASLMMTPTGGPTAMFPGTSSVNANLRFIQRLLIASLTADSQITAPPHLMLGPSADLLADADYTGSPAARYAADADIQATAVVNEFLSLPKRIAGMTGGSSSTVATLGLAFKATEAARTFTPVGARTTGSEALQQQAPPPHHFTIKKKP